MDTKDFLLNLGIVAGLTFLVSLSVANWMFKRKARKSPPAIRRDVCDSSASKRTLASELGVFEL